MREPHLGSIGEVLWDLFPDGARFGGAPANFACHAALLGGKVSMVSAVGDDARGEEAIQILSSFGVQTSYMQVVAELATGTVGVDTDAEGRPTYTIHDNAAWDSIIWNPELEALIESADTVYFGTLCQRSQLSQQTILHGLEVAKSHATPRILDINLRVPFFDDSIIRQSLENADLLKFSDEELTPILSACGVTNSPDPLLAILEKYQLTALVMTQGAKGAIYRSSTETVKHSGLPTAVVDTVGAGDAFTAAFALGRLEGLPVSNTLEQACHTAAAVCAHPGAIPN